MNCTWQNYARTYYFNWFPNSQTDCVLYAGNYFNENPLEEEKVIIIQDVDQNFIYHLMYNKYLKLHRYNVYYNLTFSDFKTYYESINASYLLFNAGFSYVKYAYKNYFIRNLTVYFDILYTNQKHWLFAKLKSE